MWGQVTLILDSTRVKLLLPNYLHNVVPNVWAVSDDGDISALDAPVVAFEF